MKYEVTRVSGSNMTIEPLTHEDLYPLTRIQWSGVWADWLKLRPLRLAIKRALGWR